MGRYPIEGTIWFPFIPSTSCVAQTITLLKDDHMWLYKKEKPLTQRLSAWWPRLACFLFMLLSVLTYHEHSFNRFLSHMLLYVVLPLLLSLFHRNRYCVFFGRVMLSYLLKSAHLSQEQGEKRRSGDSRCSLPF